MKTTDHLWIAQHSLAAALDTSQQNVRRWARRIDGVKVDALSGSIRLSPRVLVVFSIIFWIRRSAGRTNQTSMVRSLAKDVFKRMSRPGSVWLYIDINRANAGLESKRGSTLRGMWTNLRTYEARMEGLIASSPKEDLGNGVIRVDLAQQPLARETA